MFPGKDKHLRGTHHWLLDESLFVELQLIAVIAINIHVWRA